ncbi:parallel beta-helix repeat protein [Neobacillus niacini]|uniref:right-handed parallel beta-helix repeat-containing protein n=1 Tax=Neobacillus driksii TaxID=3035913 RepID=UPI00277F087D|nr:right-handed parallel beta-helix repeat-containing protein [Neobacillus niacini]MDQ0974627.1 parallel beta-helix repeat protein [Neobacillus niacini]
MSCEDKEELKNKIGDLSDLQTTEKSNLVGAINELDTELAEIATKGAIKISDYGAHSIDEVGYSTFDSTAAINAAIQAAVNSKTQKAVDFGNGRYYALNINLASGITYFSTSGAEIITKPDTTYGVGTLVNVRSVSNIKIFGLTFNGNKGVVPGDPNDGTKLIGLDAATNVYIQNCYLYNNGYNAISIANGCNNIHVLDNEINNVDCGVILQGTRSNHIEIANNVIHDGTSDCIVAYSTNPSTNIVIDGNICYNKTGGNGIIIRAIKQATITNNVINNCSTGISGRSPDSTQANGVIATIIANNTITNTNSGSGVTINYMTNSMIEGNLISDIYQYGMGLTFSDNNTIQNNTIVNCNLQKQTHYPMYLTSCNNNIVKQNVIRDNKNPINHTQTIVINGSSVAVSNNNFLIGNIGYNTSLSLFLIQANSTNTICVDNIGGYPIDQGTGTMIISNRKTNGQMATVTVSSNIATLVNGFEHQKFAASSAQTVDSINGGTFAGQKLFIIFNDVNTTLVDNTGNLRLNGNFTPTAVNSTISLVYDGANWIELCRSNN